MIWIDVALWTIVAGFAIWVFTRSPLQGRRATRAGALDFVSLLPRIMIAVIGSGFIAAVIPPSIINGYIGPDSGWSGTLIAAIGGTIAPGGPVVGYSIAFAALKGGAGHPQVVAFVVAWTLFALHRVILWETPFMSGRFIALRVTVSLPLPFLAATAAYWLGRP